MGNNNKDRRIDQLLSIIILCLYAVIIAIKWVMVYQNVAQGAITAMDIMRTIVLCLIFLIVLYNACCWTSNIVFRIIFIILALFLIASAIAMQIPQVQQFFVDYKIPLVV